MSRIVAYEIQTYAGGQWRIQAIFDDKELALAEVRRMRQSRPSLAVRIVEEQFDEAEGRATSRVLFRESPIDVHNEKAMEVRLQVEREATDARSRRDAERVVRTSRLKERKAPSFVQLGVIFVIIVAAGLGAIAGLHLLAN